MKVVVYDDAMFEPITVLNLRGVDEREIIERDGLWLVPVFEPLEFNAGEAVEVLNEAKIVELRFERFIRRSTRHGTQERWLCFTSAIDLVLLLEPSWLLGQEEAIYQIEKQNERLTELLMRQMGW